MIIELHEMILTKYFITQGFQSQHHTLFRKKERKREGKKEKIKRTKERGGKDSNIRTK